MVFQTYALYPHMSVADNMAFSLRLTGVSKATMIYVTHDQVEAMTMADRSRSPAAPGPPRAAPGPTARAKIVVLQGGIIEQAGSPLELYHHPENLFVAGFIGSPKMNFLETTVTAADGGGVTVAVPGGSSTVTVPVQPGSARAGDTVTLGIRPEHLRPDDQGQIQGEVLVAERLGGETFLYVQATPELMIVVQADGEIPTRVHDRIGIQINPEHTHLFDRQGKAIERARRHPLAVTRSPTCAGPRRARRAEPPCARSGVQRLLRAAEGAR